MCEAGQLGGKQDQLGRLIAADIAGGGVDVEAADRALLAFVVRARAAGLGERQEPRDEELLVVEAHRQPARLEMALAVRVVAQAVAQVDVADDVLVQRVDDRDRVLAAIGDEDPLAVGRGHDVPWLGAGA